MPTGAYVHAHLHHKWSIYRQALEEVEEDLTYMPQLSIWNFKASWVLHCFVDCSRRSAPWNSRFSDKWNRFELHRFWIL